MDAREYLTQIELKIQTFFLRLQKIKLFDNMKIKKTGSLEPAFINLVEMKGIEPMTSSSQTTRSPAELHPHFSKIHCL